jgi:hypothetical protein
VLFQEAFGRTCLNASARFFVSATTNTNPLWRASPSDGRITLIVPAENPSLANWRKIGIPSTMPSAQLIIPSDEHYCGPEVLGLYLKRP